MKKLIAKRAKKVVALIGIAGLCLSLGGCGKLAKLAVDSLQKDSEVAETENEEFDFEDESETEEEFDEDDDLENDSDTAAEPQEEESSRASADYNTELGDDIYSFTFALDGEVYQVPMWFKDFEAKGWEFDGDRTVELKSNQYTFSQYWEKGDLRIHTSIANLTPNNAALEDCAISEFNLSQGYNFDEDCVIELPGGIVAGKSTREDIINAYGEPTDELETDYTWNLSYELDIYNGVKLTVDKETGWLREVELENMVELEGGNYEINEDTPDEVKNYQPPTSLSDSVYDKQFELDGVLYSVACPLQYMIDHGFEVDEETLSTEIGSGGSGVINIKYKKNSMVVTIKNIADYGTIVRNCWVQSVDFDVYGEVDSFECSGGLYPGMSENDFLALLENYEYEKSEDYDYYYIKQADDDNGEVKVYVKDGQVYSVEIKNRLK